VSYRAGVAPNGYHAPVHCPACDSTNVHASKPRGGLEAALRSLTHSQWYRCHECGGRGRYPLKLKRRTRRMVQIVTAIAFVVLGGGASLHLLHNWVQEAQQQAEQAGNQ
jgi:transposase-like protein